MYTKLHLACLEPNPSLLWVYNGVLISCSEVNKFPNPPVPGNTPVETKTVPRKCGNSLHQWFRLGDI